MTVINKTSRLRVWKQDGCCERQCLDLACQEEEEEEEEEEELWVRLGSKMAVG